MLRQHLSKNITGGREGLLFPAAGDPTHHLAPASLYRVFYPAGKAQAGPTFGGTTCDIRAPFWPRPQEHRLAELMARLGHSTPQAAMRYQHASRGRDMEIAAPLSKLVEAKS